MDSHDFPKFPGRRRCPRSGRCPLRRGTLTGVLCPVACGIRALCMQVSLLGSLRAKQQWRPRCFEEFCTSFPGFVFIFSKLKPGNRGYSIIRELFSPSMKCLCEHVSSYQTITWCETWGEQLPTPHTPECLGAQSPWRRARFAWYR